MERQRREASQKIKNYRSFHLSGDLSNQLVGTVAQGILQFDSPDRANPFSRHSPEISTIGDTAECSPISPDNNKKTHADAKNRRYLDYTQGVNALQSPSFLESRDHRGVAQLDTIEHTDCTHVTPDSASTGIAISIMSEELKAELEKQKQATMLLQKQVAEEEMRNALEKEKQDQEAWQAALDKLKQAREEQGRKHAEKLATLQAVNTASQEEKNPQKGTRVEREQPQKKWFCRDWNKSEGCSKQAPHKAWFGTGTNAVSRTVLHICAACYMKERAVREHPETSEACPHKSS